MDGLAVTLEYGCMLPRSGGDKVYLEFTYRHPRFLATVLVAVQSVLLGFTASNCVVFAEYVLFALDREPSKSEVKILAAGLLHEHHHHAQLLSQDWNLRSKRLGLG